MHQQAKMRLFIFFVFVTWQVCLTEFCCFPKQWEGTLSIWLPYSPQGGLYTQMNKDISVDLTGQRVRGYTPSTGETQLMFFREGVAYTIVNSTCSKESVSPWPSSAFCVPGDAKLIRKYQLGTKEQMNVADYIFTTNDKTSPFKEQTIRTVTDNSLCQPVEDKVILKYSDSDSTDVWTVTYENVTPGVKDPSVFDVPSFCKSSNRKMKAASLEGSHFLRNVVYEREMHV